MRCGKHFPCFSLLNEIKKQMKKNQNLIRFVACYCFSWQKKRAAWQLKYLSYGNRKRERKQKNKIKKRTIKPEKWFAWKLNGFLFRLPKGQATTTTKIASNEKLCSLSLVNGMYICIFWFYNPSKSVCLCEVYWKWSMVETNIRKMCDDKRVSEKKTRNWALDSRRKKIYSRNRIRLLFHQKLKNMEKKALNIQWYLWFRFKLCAKILPKVIRYTLYYDDHALFPENHMLFATIW